jgi:K+-transporting ATPase ATPase A chain
MSYLTQMLGLATHNFWSAAVGIALAIAFIRGIARREMKTLGNFWVDLTRGTLWVLLPISIVFALALVSQGVVQNFKPYDTANLVQPQSVTITGADGKPATTPSPRRPSRRPRRLAGSHQDARHQRRRLLQRQQRASLREPHPLSNFLQTPLHLPHPRGLTSRWARWSARPKHGWAVLAAMTILWFAASHLLLG